MTRAADRTLAGIGLGVAAYLLFSTHDAANKFLAASLPVSQILFFRSLTIVAGSLAAGRRPLLLRVLHTPLKRALIGRAALTLTAWLLYYTASRDLTLARMMTLYFSSPIMVTLLAMPLLGERVTAARWVSLGLGFLGVCLASDPLGLSASLATAMVLAAAMLWAVAIILMRQIARRETSMVQMVYQNSCFLVVTGAVTALNWVTPSPLELALLIGVGVLGGGGQFLLFEGVRLAPASVMGTVEYTGLIWAFLFGFLIWGDIPSLATWGGAGLILGSGVLLVVVEGRRK
jgi:drug/metabolite transporter (DMT)-like permease